MNPLVSVIIPAYNAEKTLIRCLDSVSNQTYKNLEIIVIDDGSKDLTLQLLQNYSNEHLNLNLQFYSIPNSGPASARNYGIAHASGEYIAFLDSDDRWSAKKIETQMDCLIKNPNIHLLGCDYSIGNLKPCKIRKDKYQMISKRSLLLKNIFLTPCVIIKSSVFNSHKFEEKQKYSEDYYLWLEIVCNNHACAFLNETLTILDDKPTYGQSGLSGSLWKMEKGELCNFKRLHEKKLISGYWLLIASSFSLIKYCKRIILTLLRKLKHKP